MQNRDFTYLSVELHELAGQAILYLRQFSPAHSGFTGLERANKPGGIDKTRQICTTYWWAVSERLDVIFEETNKDELQQQVIEIRELSAKLSEDLFDEEALEFIFRAARETDILVITTNLVEVPWEALVNPKGMNGEFLSRYCIVSRIFVPNEPRSRAFRRNDPVVGGGLFVDAVLLRKWSERQNENHNDFARLCRGQNPVVGKNVDELFDAMDGKKVVQWICDNSFDELTRSIDCGSTTMRIAQGRPCLRILSPKTALWFL